MQVKIQRCKIFAINMSKLDTLQDCLPDFRPSK